tara:strand:- start:44 stop:226 length:183 start_codon:yes stop_codon:yes gene_type:complete
MRTTNKTKTRSNMMEKAIEIAKEILNKINTEYDPIRHRYLVYAVYETFKEFSPENYKEVA